MIIDQRPPQIFGGLSLQDALQFSITNLKGNIQLEKMPFFIVNVNEVRYLLWVDGKICSFEKLLFR